MAIEFKQIKVGDNVRVYIKGENERWFSGMLIWEPDARDPWLWLKTETGTIKINSIHIEAYCLDVE